MIVHERYTCLQYNNFVRADIPICAELISVRNRSPQVLNSYGFQSHSAGVAGLTQ